MSFHEIQFPPRLSAGALGGPERLTEVVALANGFEERNTPWAYSRRRYDAGTGMRSLDDIATLIAFFEARRGRLHGFRWKDWSDYKSCLPSATVASTDQEIGTGDGARTEFALTKTYVSGDQSYARPIAKPVPGTVLVAVDGVALIAGADFAVDTASGVVTLATAPGAETLVTAGFQFDVPVRFDADSVLTSVENLNAGNGPEVPVIEVRT